MKSRFPFPSFPSGWFFVGFSHELQAEAVKPLHYFGQELVLFRTQDGTAHMFDAHCPHLGAHLGHGGRVKGNTIQCPFHGWCFNSTGQGVEIPYTSKIPLKAQIRTWQVREVNGWILVYYPAQAEVLTWEILELPEYVSRDWLPFQSIHKWKIRTHIRELAENGMDVAHLPFLHGQIIATFNSESLEANGPVHIHRVSTKYKLPAVIGISGRTVDGTLEITSHGLGCQISRVWVKAVREMRILIIFLLTPIDQAYIEVNLVVSLKKFLNKPITHAISAIYAREAIKSLEQDIPILENKIYLNCPLLCEGEGSLSEYRHWANQFFSDSEEPAMTKILVQKRI